MGKDSRRYKGKYLVLLTLSESEGVWRPFAGKWLAGLEQSDLRMLYVQIDGVRRETEERCAVRACCGMRPAGIINREDLLVTLNHWQQLGRRKRARLSVLDADLAVDVEAI